MNISVRIRMVKMGPACLGDHVSIVIFNVKWNSYQIKSSILSIELRKATFLAIRKRAPIR